MLTINEVAQIIGCTHVYIRKLVVDGRIAAKKVGRDWVVMATAEEIREKGKDWLIRRPTKPRKERSDKGITIKMKRKQTARAFDTLSPSFALTKPITRVENPELLEKSKKELKELL